MFSLTLFFLLTLAGNHPAATPCGCITARPDETTGRGGHDTIRITERRTHRELRGVVIDPMGDIMNDALVEVIRNATAFPLYPETGEKLPRVAACKTSKNGRFCFPRLRAGKYELRISKMGFNNIHIFLTVAPQHQNSSRRHMKIRMELGL
jgi:hypothetical protein